jgi:hypothetical protein
LTIADIAPHFPHLMVDIQEIDNEWRMLRNLDFQELGIDYNEDPIVFWNNIGI